MSGSDRVKPSTPDLNLTGRVFYAPSDVVFSEHDVVEPDLFYLSNERATQVLTAANVKGAPDLVIEIGSPSTRQRDETIKRHLYERSGVSEYWVIDPDIDVVRVYRHLPLARVFRE
jgi:Uma2 family endonuclease